MSRARTLVDALTPKELTRKLKDRIPEGDYYVHTLETRAYTPYRIGRPKYGEGSATDITQLDAYYDVIEFFEQELDAETEPQIEAAGEYYNDYAHSVWEALKRGEMNGKWEWTIPADQHPSAHAKSGVLHWELLTSNETDNRIEAERRAERMRQDREVRQRLGFDAYEEALSPKDFLKRSAPLFAHPGGQFEKPGLYNGVIWRSTKLPRLQATTNWSSMSGPLALALKVPENYEQHGKQFLLSIIAQLKAKGINNFVFVTGPHKQFEEGLIWDLAHMSNQPRQIAVTGRSGAAIYVTIL